MDPVTLAIICYTCLVVHWYTEIKEQRITNLINLVLLFAGITNLFLIQPEKHWLYLSGLIVCAFVPWVVFKLGGTFGGGTYKLLIVSGLILGLWHALILLTISPLLYTAYKRYCMKYEKRYYPSGISILAMLPFHFLSLLSWQ